ncbi:hypothetical protein NKI48_21510 [Mesorhizobium sp. M0644]|uniref:hypothetical protein n=1 Tax=unclassified Mesorhizobium TaxID=325217 RepID=UPI003335B6E3
MRRPGDLAPSIKGSHVSRKPPAPPALPKTRSANRTGYQGKPHDGAVEDESKHFVYCPVCGQTFDARDLGQVFHHAEPQHERLPVEQ